MLFAQQFQYQMLFDSESTMHIVTNNTATVFLTYTPLPARVVPATPWHLLRVTTTPKLSSCLQTVRPLWASRVASNPEPRMSHCTASWNVLM